MHFVTFQTHVQNKTKIFKAARIRKKYIILFPGIYNVSGNLLAIFGVLLVGSKYKTEKKKWLLIILKFSIRILINNQTNIKLNCSYVSYHIISQYFIFLFSKKPVKHPLKIKHIILIITNSKFQKS